MNPNFELSSAKRQSFRQDWAEFIRDNDMTYGCNVDAVGKRGTFQICVEQGDNTSHPGDADPDSQVVGPIMHHETDGGARRKPLLMRPTRILVGSSGQVLEGKGFAF